MSFQGSWHDGPQGGTPLDAGHLNAEELRLHDAAVADAAAAELADVQQRASYAVAIKQVATDRLRLLYALGSERFWGVDLWQTASLPGAGGISGYVAPNMLSRAAIYEPFLNMGSGAVTRTGTFVGPTAQALASGGSYYYSTTVGDKITATIPAGATKVGLRTVPASNAGLFVPVIGGDRTRANRLPTAAQLVASGRLAALGALNATDRVLDLYSAASDAATTIDYDRHFILADGAGLGGQTIELVVVAEKNFASAANRGYVSLDPFTYAKATTSRGTGGASLLATTRLLSHLDSAYEYAHEVGIPGTPTFIGNVHGYETQTGLAVLADGRVVTLSVGDTLWANRIDLTRDTNLYHPAVGSGNTVIGSVKTFYTLRSLGLDVVHRTSWAQAVTLTRDYPMMFPGDGGLLTFAVINGTSYPLGANDGSYKGQVPTTLAQTIGADGGLAIVLTLSIIDQALSVDNFALSAPMYTAAEDRAPVDANVGNVKKIYVTRVHTTGGPLALASGAVQFSAGRYTVSAQ